MNCFPNITMRALACRAGTLLAVYCLSVAGVWTESNAGNSLNRSTGDIFTTSSELVFDGPPQPLLLAQASVSSEASANWESSRPPTDQFDWVQTTSGEWLKGELTVLYSDQLEFDSDEFGIQMIDWGDIAQLLSHGAKRISVDSPEGPRVFVGVVTVDGEKISVVSSTGLEEFDRSLLISITPGADSEQDNWSTKISFGLNLLAATPS